MPSPRQVHRASTFVLSVLMVVVGAAMVVSAIAAGGGALAVGVVLGILFCVAGGIRLALLGRGG